MMHWTLADDLKECLRTFRSSERDMRLAQKGLQPS
jgi:hypothetical protein